MAPLTGEGLVTRPEATGVPCQGVGFCEFSGSRTHFRSEGRKMGWAGDPELLEAGCWAGCHGVVGSLPDPSLSSVVAGPAQGRTKC